MKRKLLSMLVLLAAVVTGARADQLASSYSSNATLNEVTVSASMEVTIATGVTVTINNGLNITSGTLTVKGPGTLVVNGKAGSNGGYSALSNGGNGTPGSAAITGNIIVQGGATVKATGGNGGNGGNSGSETGGNGAQGGAAITGEVTIQDASTLEATGGNGGNGGNGDDGGNGGNGGVAFAGTLTYKGGTVTADGGNGGSGGWGDMDEGYGPSGSAGKAFTTSVNFVSSDYILTDGSNAITATQVTSKKKVVISPKVAVNSVTLAPTSATLTLGETETVTLIPTVLPDDATDKTVTWTTSNASVATVTDGVVTAVAAGTATITATATNGTADTSDDKTATCTVTVSNPTYNVTVNAGATDEYWATFYSDASNYQASSGTQVFMVNLSGTSITMTPVTGGIVKSGQGVVLKNTTGSNITMTPTISASSNDWTDNSLTGTMTSITNPGNAYVLNYKAAKGAGFYKLSSGGTIGANKAYLVSGAGAPSFFGFDGNTTGIDATLVNSEKVNSVVYDLQGRKVAQPTKGLYIVNGKKVVIK